MPPRSTSKQRGVADRPAGGVEAGERVGDVVALVVHAQSDLAEQGPTPPTQKGLVS
jgi:hypothetical protein